eukprot:6333575-Ditylum_brightwellii.AAC.1
MLPIKPVASALQSATSVKLFDEITTLVGVPEVIIVGISVGLAETVGLVDGDAVGSTEWAL